MNGLLSKTLVASVRSLGYATFGYATLGYATLGYVTLGWLFLSGLILAPAAIAQPQSAKSDSAQPRVVFTPPPPPKNVGAPSGRIRGGASRGSCQDYANLTALVPVQNEVARGLTTSPTPTLWFYLPAPINGDLEAEFVLQDQKDNFVYYRELDFDTDSAGIVPVTITSPEPALEANNRYRWTFALYCDPSRPSVSVHVTGWLESVSPSPSVNGESQFEQAAQAAQAGLWFDSLTALGELRQTEPNNPDYQQAWMELLQQIELDDVVAAPLL